MRPNVRPDMISLRITYHQSRGDSSFSAIARMISVAACDPLLPPLDMISGTNKVSTNTLSNSLWKCCMAVAVSIMRAKPRSELIWDSPRELLNIFQADQVGCHIITATTDILKKLSLVDKDLEQYSLETVEMFYKDASAAGYTITAGS